jgi:hypothetical protein
VVPVWLPGGTPVAAAVNGMVPVEEKNMIFAAAPYSKTKYSNERAVYNS